MKSIIFIFCFTFFSFSLWCQNPWQWAIASDTSQYSSSQIDNMALDGDGNILIAGQYNGSLSLKGTAFTPTVLSGGYYSAKISKNGMPIWVNTGKGSNFYINSICTDQNNNSYVLGEIQAPMQTFTIGTTVLTNTTGGNTLFIIKNDPNGNICWAKIIGKSAASSAHFGVSILNSNGFLYINGQFLTSTTSPCSIGAYTLSSLPSPPNTNSDIFMAKLDTAGNVLSANSYGGQGYETVNKLFITSTNEILFSGTTNSTLLTLGTYSITGPSSGVFKTLFLGKMDELGNINWARQINDVKDGGTMVADQVGNMYLAGSFKYPGVVVDNYTITSSAASTNVMLIKFNATGNALWFKSIGGDGSANGFGENFSDITIDNYGGIYVLGSYLSPSIAIGSHTLTNTNINKERLFVAQFDQSGNVAGVLQAGGNNARTLANCLLIDNDYNVLVAGIHDAIGQGISFGSMNIYGSYQNQGSLFLAKAGGAFTGITKYQEKLELNLYPVPSTDKVSIVCETSLIKKIEIIDLTGRIVQQIQCSSNYIDLSIGELKVGVYLVRVTLPDQQTMIAKLIKED